METVGQRVKKLRLAQGLSLRKLGELIGSSGSYVKQLEDGDFLPGGRLLTNLANVLNTSTDYILTGKPDSVTFDAPFPEDQLRAEGLPDNEIERLSGLWEQFPDKRVGLLESAHDLARAYAKLHNLTAPSDGGQEDAQKV